MHCVPTYAVAGPLGVTGTPHCQSPVSVQPSGPGPSKLNPTRAGLPPAPVEEVEDATVVPPAPVEEAEDATVAPPAPVEEAEDATVAPPALVDAADVLAPPTPDEDACVVAAPPPPAELLDP